MITTDFNLCILNFIKHLKTIFILEYVNNFKTKYLHKITFSLKLHNNIQYFSINEQNKLMQISLENITIFLISIN